MSQKVKKIKAKIHKIRVGIHKRPLHVSVLTLLIINGSIFALAFTYFNVNTPSFSSAIASTYSVPSTIPDNCSVDNSPDLQTFLNGLPPDSVVNFPTNGCYLTQERVSIQSTNGLTINGNGSTFQRTDPTKIDSNNTLPILQLLQNSNLTINGLTLNGNYDGNNYGGPAFEGHSGILMESNHGLTLDDMNVVNIQGDFIDVQFDDGDLTNKDHSPNTDVTIMNSTFTTCGYHGLSVEGVNGLIFKNNTVSNVQEGAMDFEYDIYSSEIVNGVATGAVEDNVQILNNTWDHVANIWFASLQGQEPGVQEQNITLSGNVINASQPILDINGTNQSTPNSSPPYWFQGLTVTNNTINGAAKGTNGGSITQPFVDEAMDVRNVSNVNISNNYFPIYDGTPTYYPNHPYLAALTAHNLNGFKLANNNFNGALGVLRPDSEGNTNVTECGNNYGVGGAELDFSCTAPPPSCPPGDTGTYPNCVPPVNPPCPTGDTGTYPNCKPPQNLNCPTGDTGTYPNCIVPGAPGSGSGGYGITGPIQTIRPSSGGTTQIFNPNSRIGHTSSDPITSKNLLIEPSIKGKSSDVSKVVYAIDNKLIATVTRPPFLLDIKTANIENGCHILTTTMYYTNGSINIQKQNLCISHQLGYLASSQAKIELPAIGILASAAIYLVILFKHRKRAWLYRFESHNNDLDIHVG